LDTSFGVVFLDETPILFAPLSPALYFTIRLFSSVLESGVVPLNIQKRLLAALILNFAIYQAYRSDIPSTHVRVTRVRLPNGYNFGDMTVKDETLIAYYSTSVYDG
jgi:hypothetical protein